MPHPDLNDDIRSLVRMVRLGATQNQIRNISQRIYGVLLSKHNRLVGTAGINLLLWCNALRGNPQGVNQLLQTRDFEILLHRDLDIILHHGIRANNIYCPHHAMAVDAVRIFNRIVLENTFVALGNPNNRSIQSWARPSSKSHTYNRHLRTSRAGASRFSIGIRQVETIEYQLFNSGVGILDAHNRIFFYGLFNNQIGTLRGGGVSSYVKMQCDRVPRLTGTGTRVVMHSYPISLAEIRNDFGAGGRPHVAQIQNNVLQIP